MPDLKVKPRFWHALIRKIAATQFGIWLLSDKLHRLDKAFLRITDNQTSLTSILAGLPVIVLTTTGARSGLTRHTSLVALAEDDRIILIASYFGSDRHPAWYHNLRANPQVSISHAGQSGRYLARLASGEERDRCWEKAVNLYPGYELYKQKASGRQIPVVILEPVSPVDQSA